MEERRQSRSHPEFIEVLSFSFSFRVVRVVRGPPSGPPSDSES